VRLRRKLLREWVKERAGRERRRKRDSDLIESWWGYYSELFWGERGERRKITSVSHFNNVSFTTRG
jgi:hypothetical protein